MKIRKIISLGWTLLAAGQLLTSCEISEPDTQSGSSDELLLSALTWNSIKVMAFDYDSQNRLTKINAPEFDYLCELRYEGTSKYPSNITITDYTYEYDAVKGDDVRRVDCVLEWSNIEFNSAGYIKKNDSRETSYYYDYYGQESSEVETWVTTWEYDSEGHLTVINDVDGPSTLTWKDGLLMTIHTNDGETINYEYSDVANKNLQWDPVTLNQVVGPLFVTNFFGKAPVKFANKGDNLQFAYALLDNGMIGKCKIYDEDEGNSTTYNFVYSKKK